MSFAHSRCARATFDLFALAPLFAQPESEEALRLQIHYVTFLAGQGNEVYLRAGKLEKRTVFGLMSSVYVLPYLKSL